MSESLWYKKPATKWSEGLPLGNGRVGAVIISDGEKEVWSLTEITFWSGKSESSPARYGGKKAIKDLQAVYLNGGYAEGKRLAERYLEPPKQNFGTCLELGKVHIDFEKHGVLEDFRRELKFDEGIARTSYGVNGHSYQREAFVSHPQDVLVSSLTTDSPEGLSISISLTSENDVFIVKLIGNDTLEFTAQATEKLHSDGQCGVWGSGAIKVNISGGSFHSQNDKIGVKNASQILIYLAFNTDFRRPDATWKSLASDQIKNAEIQTYERLKSEHVKDQRALYNRVSISLPSRSQSSLPADERRKVFKSSGYNDPAFFALYFQYARYLTIAGTRFQSPLPLHLQGLWNDGEACRMNWSCDYHLDINTQMNYFALHSGNLIDCFVPLRNYCKYLADAGKNTATEFYGSPGWVAHVFSNVWGFTDPGWETSWGLNVTGGLWMASHLIEHYEYTLDNDFLTKHAYPVLKEAAEFFLDYMVQDPESGYLLTGPSVSPENSFFPPNTLETEHQLSLAPTIDTVLIRDLFVFLLEIAKDLNIESSFAQRVSAALPLLPPLQIGSRGQLQEWLYDFAEAQPDHRHMSHTIALCRSSQITLRETPDLAAAVRKTLELRQARADLEDIEFTAALFGANFARLGDAESAQRQIGHLIGELSLDNLLSFSKAGIAGATTDVFVIDGNFGGAAVIAEMLVRSVKVEEIEILPALPRAWNEGYVKGIRVRGGGECDVTWRSGVLEKVELRWDKGGEAKVWYGRASVDLKYEPRDAITLDGGLQQTSRSRF